MRRNSGIVVSLFFGIGLGFSTEGFGWVVEESCAAQLEQDRAALRQLLQAAPVGSVHEVPRPFPTTEAEILEDFLFKVRGWVEAGKPERQEDLTFRNELESGSLRFEIVRVEEWMPMRCYPGAANAFYFLIRAFDRRTEAEVARAALAESGLLEELLLAQQDWSRERPLIDLGEGLAQVASWVGFRKPPQDAQYVTTGGTQRCPLLFPCVAFRQEGKVMLLVPQGKEVAAFELGSELLDRSACVRTPEEASGRYDRLVEQAKSKGEELFMLGGNLLGTARPRWRGAIPAKSQR